MSKASFEFPPALQQYMITEAEFFKQNPQYGKVCTGVVVCKCVQNTDYLKEFRDMAH
jgi:hypothetical protein